mmetsp:Transcript_27784/g.39242  ORF Transcript_27784/g.39242 Transcript_27784/m.39242 type:complete len:249 (-) Transcript_27784:324-1070(-)
MRSILCFIAESPSVAVAIAWVSPRVKRADPCTRGKKPASISNLRISVSWRPSHLRPVSLALMNMRRHSKSLKAVLMATFCSGNSWSSSVTTAFDNVDMTDPIWSLFPLIAYIWSTRSENKASTRSCKPSGGEAIVSNIFSFPATFPKAWIASQIVLIVSWPSLTAVTISASVKKSAAPSIMRTASCVPAIVRLSLLFSICSLVGFTTYSPSTKPTMTAATGLHNGTSEMYRAVALAVIANGSQDLIPS